MSDERRPKTVRLQPRDVDAAYIVGRFALVTAEIWPLLWGSRSGAARTLARLERARILRSFARTNLAAPKFYALTAVGKEWLLDQKELDEKSLRVVSGIARVNLVAVRRRNALWISATLASRRDGHARMILFRPEWELRASRSDDVHAVPDAAMTIAPVEGGANAGAAAITCFIEHDEGSERLAMIRQKAACYAQMRERALVYGAERGRWSVLFVVPSSRRGHTVSQALVDGGGAGFSLVGAADTMSRGRAFDPVLWEASELARDRSCAPSRSVLDALSPHRETAPRDRAAAAQSSPRGSEGTSQ